MESRHVGGICVASLNVGAWYHHQIILPPMHRQHTESFSTVPPFSSSTAAICLLQQPHQQHPPWHPRHATAPAPALLPSSASYGPQSCCSTANEPVEVRPMQSRPKRFGSPFKKKRLLPLVSMLLLFPSSFVETHLDWKLVGGVGIGAG